ncbi:hypothetical protein H311_04257 [Anncaliia algerae PRA109]|uniref:Uncharacterized protein n=1 Tax=Anncaliia algerae PRA339 TaxID=1288291 RepID=A0A059F4J9_9MICR|nr:hypothetical protein H311_04257 [Anncaliia algerae PRA109]KCZ81896.1 hypothetical protein H312_00655 [Anncaliia algerae PRA339]
MLVYFLCLNAYVKDRTVYIRPMFVDQENSIESDTKEENNYYSQKKETINSGLNQSVSSAKLKASPNNLKDVLNQEFNDVSAELNNKLTGQIENLQTRGDIDREKFKQVFVIGKHVVSDGKRKVVKINIKEQIVPKEKNEEITIDIGTKALLGCILFLLVGLVFTTTMKVYQGFLKKQYNRNIENRKNNI